jgi:4-oxalocrotonate tautomerase
MPHIIVKLWPGQSEKKKRQLADAIVEQGSAILGYGDESFSVAFEEIEPERWAHEVYAPDIKSKWKSLYKQPGYKK